MRPSVWVAKQKPHQGFHFILKTLFYADKFHLQKYGRPVLGDTYIKMDWGPVASTAYDLRKQSDFAPENALDAVSNALHVQKVHRPDVIAKREPNMALFSGTDIEALEEALHFCQDKDFNDLSDITHKEKAWIDALMNSKMDYELFIDEDVENRDELIEYIRENSQTVVV
ncbi:MAG: Panacea domain-containing protein [Desulfovermiculus sp.]|nr:Panacea domain-containing protein [Desulfovermiculus sp.]